MHIFVQTADSRHNTLTNKILIDPFMLATSYLKVFILIMILMTVSASSQQLFIKNVGQWESDIMYAGSGEGYNIVIARSGIYINHQQVNKVEEKQDEFGNKRNEVFLSSDNFRLHFAGSDIENNIVEKMLSGRLSEITYDFWNYGPNGDWYWDVPCYEEIIISDIYPDISMKFYYEGNDIRYDFELGASANFNEIKMLVQGAQSNEIIGNELIIKTKLGEVRNGKIKSFVNSSGEELLTEIKINQLGEISFDIDINNKLNEKITIDPLIYSSYLYNQTAIDPYYGSFNVQQRGDEYWLRVWDYSKLNYYTDTIDYTNRESVYLHNTIIVYDNSFKKIKKYIAVSYVGTNKILFPDDEHLLIALYAPEEKFSEYNITNLDIIGALCLLKINFRDKKVLKGIRIPSTEFANIYLSADNRILLSYHRYGNSNKYAYLTDNAYFSGCDSSFSKDCWYPYIVAVSSDLKEIEYATLIPYSFPYSRDLRSVIIPDILTDSKGNIYFINRIPYIFMNKYENIIGNWSGTMPGIFNGHYTSIHKFDKNYNMVKSAAVVFVAVRHFLIDKNDELILIGNVNETILDEIWLHDDCLKPTKNEWWKQGKDFHYKIGIMKLDKDLKYLRSGIIPGGYFIDYFDESTAHYFPNSASDALLDDENNIYLTNGIANYFYNAYIIDGSETYKRGNIDYTVDIDKHNYDVGIMKVKNDLTKILYSTIYGGSGVDVPGFIFLNDTIVTIVGATYSKDLIVTPDADVSYPHNPTERLFVAKLSTNTPSSLPSEMPGKTYIFPNPASTYIELPESLMSLYSEYHVTDLLGRTISMNRLQIPRIDISALPTGTYKLTLTHGTDIISYLFIKME